jgi:hypothetical protein
MNRSYIGLDMENFWSLLKLAVKVPVRVELFHLFRCLDEQVFRFNGRNGKDHDRFVSVADSVSGKRLTYGKLIGEGAECKDR